MLLLATQLENLVLLVQAVFSSGRLQIAHLSRNLPSPTKFHHKQKRILRFLANPRIQPPACFPYLLTMILRLNSPSRLISVVIDQTNLLPGYEALVASIPFRRRALPFAFTIFRPDEISGSQNQIENEFFALVTRLLRVRGLNPIILLDRGYADVKIIQLLKRLQVHFIIRVPRNVFVELPDYSGTLAQLMCPGRWAAIEYQYYVRESVNLTTFWGKDKQGNSELICLVSDLTPNLARQRYRLRMHIEEGFKDIKDALGFNYLRLKVAISERLERVLLVVMVATITAGYLYSEALVYAPQVTKHPEDLSFVRLVVFVYQFLWRYRASGFG